MDYQLKPINLFQDDGLSKEDRVMINGLRVTVIEADKRVIDPSNFGRFDMIMINRGKCMLCGKELTEGEGLFFCERCENKRRDNSYEK